MVRNRLDIFVFEIIYIILLVYFAVDVLAGIILSVGISNFVSVPVKIVLLLLMLSLIIKNRKAFGLMIFLFLFSGISLFHLIYIDKFAGAINNMFKLIYCPIMYAFFHIFNDEMKEYKVVKINTIILAANMILGILGYGFKTYKNQAGVKGFFYAGNELSIVVFCLFVYWYIKSNYSNKVLGVFLPLAFIVGTKAAVFAVLLYFILLKINVENKNLIKSLLSIFFLVGGAFLARGKLLELRIVKFHINNMKWHSIANRTFLNNLLSGRITYIKDLLVYVSNNKSLSSILFGYGIPNKMAEIDIIDTMFSYGIVMAIVISGFYIYVFDLNKENKNIMYFNLVYLLLSFSAGHVWFNTTSTLLFCILNTTNFYRVKDIQSRRFHLKIYR